MKNKIRTYTALALTVFIGTGYFRVSAQEATKPAEIRTEEAYRANNVGVALLEQFKYEDGVNAFQRALKLDSKLALARVNLCIALYNVPDLAAADREAKAAIELAPAYPQPYYIRGLVARAGNNPVEAIAAFRKVLEIDPYDVGANVNLGQIYVQQRQLAEAIGVFRAAVASEPYNVTAAYNLATALVRAGQREEGQTMLQRFQLLRQSGAGTVIGPNYLEQGRYSEAIASSGGEAGLVGKDIPAVSFVDATAAFGLDRPPSAGAAVQLFRRGSPVLFDGDGDGDLDLFDASPAGERLYRNDGGKFEDVSKTSGLGAPGSVAATAVAGDFDNDGKTDMFVARLSGLALFRNVGDLKFTDVTNSAKLPAYPFVSVSAAFVDADHDGDLDLFIAGAGDARNAQPGAAIGDLPPAPCMLARNNGDGTFVDATTTAKVDGPAGHALSVVPTDYDNRRDVDLLVAGYGEAPRLYRNVRDGSFVDVAKDVGLARSGRYTSTAAGDVNKDGFTDFYFGESAGPGLMALSDGRNRFVATPGPEMLTDARSAQFLDYDGDGLQDLVTLTGSGLRVSRNIGNGWQDVSPKASGVQIAPAASALAGTFASGDLDLDGDTDLVIATGSDKLTIARNEGGNTNRSLRVQLTGKVSNKTGVGAKIEARAGSLWQRLEFYSANPSPAPSDVIFGLGSRTSVDAVRVLWPAGVVQAEIQNPATETARSMAVQELDRKPSSCPFLYTWNGERFEFVTDFMGGGEMGAWVAPGIRNSPDPTEYVRIRADQLRPHNGRYEIRVTNELEEALYIDELKLGVVAHPPDVEVHPNEGLRSTSATEQFRLYEAEAVRPARRAFDHDGNDITDRLAALDRLHVEGFPLDRIRGYAQSHTLTLDLGQVDPNRALLLLTGWTDYAFSSDNVAASQMGRQMHPPSLEVRDTSGEWRTVLPEMGFPVGRPQTVVVDLSGKFLSASREVRITTNMRIYWDQAAVGEIREHATGFRSPSITWLRPVRAALAWRGFSRELTPDGREPYGYDYSEVSTEIPWKLMPGRYTRVGDVRALLGRTDDMFVVSMTGDELTLSFDARRLPRVPDGWTYTFLLFVDGFSKEMDINSGSPDQVAPLPFHRMSTYPYGPGEAYPDTPRHWKYRERYNTRAVTKSVHGEPSRLSTVLVEPAP